MTIQNILITTAITVNIIFSTFLYVISSHEYRGIVSTIEKHSVHPIYGNYKKHDSKGETCEPWDSCK
jgi:hypothetical protein